MPGLAKFVVIRKPATKERSGISLFTKEPIIFKARPLQSASFQTKNLDEVQ